MCNLILNIILYHTYVLNLYIVHPEEVCQRHVQESNSHMTNKSIVQEERFFVFMHYLYESFQPLSIIN